MPQLEQIVQQITELDPVQREELVIALSEGLSLSPLVLKWLHGLPTPEFPSIVATTGVCGGEPRLIRTRIPVWVLERMRQLGVSEIDILRSYPALRATDLVQAWSYATRYRADIEKAIRENEEE
jgi:uncharacterized protein (DUF433 family)